MRGTAEVTGDVKERVAAELEAARARTTALLEPFSDDQLTQQVSPLMSPLVLGPRAHRPLRRAVDLPAARRRDADPPRRRTTPTTRSPTSGRSGPRSSCSTHAPRARTSTTFARGRSQVLEETELDADDPLLCGGFAFGLVVQHEQQHVETMLQTIQLSGWEHPGGTAGVRSTGNMGDVAVEAGSFVMGGDDDLGLRQRASRPRGGDRRVQDRRRAGLERRLRRLPRRRRLARAAALVEAGRRRVGAAPLRTRSSPCPTSSPCSTSRGTRRTRTPRGRASACRPRPSGSARRSSASCAASGKVWEWTSSDFAGYPGFRAFPYPEYSEVFFGSEYK